MTSPDLARFRDGFRRFERPARLLLTGHSHQAWPDVVRDAMARYFDDSAEHVDDKWERAVFPKVDRVGKAVLRRMGFADSDPITFGRSSHELVFRFLTGLPALARGSARARIVTTSGEFHSLRRQLARLEEEQGVEIVWVDADPKPTLGARLRAEVARGADLLALSAVFFEDAYVLRELGEVAAEALARGTLVLVDAYHAFNVVPLDLGPRKDELYVVAGGYKYAEFGEGLCFMRSPRSSALRPVYTGWFSDFGSLEGTTSSVRYGGGGDRFAGATFDPTSFYRAEAALDHFDACGLDVPALREISVRQTTLVTEVIAGAGLVLASQADPALRGGFVSVHAERAAEAQAALRAEGVYVDTRGPRLRIGPAPYLTDDEILRGTEAVVRALTRRAS